MQQSQENIPLILNLDKSRKFLTAAEAGYLLNHERSLVAGKGTLGEGSPMAANFPACEMELPTGENFAVKSYYSKLTNELYSWIYNTNGVHYIQRINGDGECEVVYHGECLQLSAKPEHEITQFRAYMQLDKLCANRHGKSLIWVNGDGPIGQIDTEASIATDFFTTPFFERCSEGCEMIQMCVPDPCGCLMGDFVPLTENDKGLKNNLLDMGFQFAYMFEYYDGRRSIWSNPSTLFYQDTKGCFDNAEGFPRCIKLRVPIGNPLVDKIHIGYSKNGVWYTAEIVEKYKKYNSSQQYWYERDLAELTNYSDEDCSFDYIFCNDKQCEVIDPVEFSRVFNPLPIKPQGILPIGIGEDRTALGFYNYEQGNCPIDKTQTEKWNFGIDCPENNCNPEYATVKVRLIVHNLGVGRNQFVYRLNGTAGGPDDPSDKAYFGGLNKALSGGFEIGYDQYFNDETRNFIVYVEGEEYWAEMKQWKSQAFWTGKEFWGVVADMDDVNTRNRWRRATRNGEFFYQEAEIKVIKGTRGFLRIASHHATGNSQDTSTFVRGIQNLFVYKGDLETGEGLTEGVEEIYFDTCNGDVDITDAFVVDDNAVDDEVSNKASAYFGYIKDDNGKPVEGAVIEVAGIEKSVTDHNGFYHFYLDPGDNTAIDIDVKVEQDCFSFSTIKTVSVQGEVGANTSTDITIEDESYVTSAYANVAILIQDCQGNPVSGVRVALSGTKYDVTDGSGYARWKIRNYESRDRELRYVVLNNKGCFSTDCNGVCNPCMPTGTTATTSCYMALPSITFPSAVINRTYSLIEKKGLKAGGRYPFGFVVRFDCGMISAVNEVIYLDIPKTQDKNKEGFCSLSYDATGFVAPAGAKCVEIVRGVNVNPFELQWVIDEIERVDGKIKLTIQSLNDYNEKYFFKTNTQYQWLKGDRIEFIKNGDGKIFTTSVYGLLNYLTISPFFDENLSDQQDAPADYFNQLLIEDDGKLDGLKVGAIIEIQRAKECATVPTYFSICASIPVKSDGTLEYPVGVFNTFDTFFVKRTIGTLPAQQFEHKFPSDFWGTLIDGEGMSDRGRAYFVNKYENKRRYGRNITINSPNVFNYFGDLVRTLDPDNHGDIIAMWITDNKIGMCISEHDNSLFQVSDDLVRVDGNGIIRASAPESIISDAQPKISGTYGCQYAHVGGIYFGDGYAIWPDVNNGTIVKHDYSQAVAADEDRAQTWSGERFQDVLTSDKNITDQLDRLRFAIGYNNATGAVMITIKKLMDDGIYNQIKPLLQSNDTLLYEPDSGDFLSFASFTPEAYGMVNLAGDLGCAFVSFLNGIPYIHPINPDKYNEFYGVACDWVVGVSMNKFPKKIKKGVGIELQDNDSLWYVADVSTENSNFRSEVPVKKVNRDRNKMNMPFLRDINSIGGLFNGREVSGYYHFVTFIRDNTDSLKYGTIDNAKRTKYSTLNMILFKFEMVGQSGLDENL